MWRSVPSETRTALAHQLLGAARNVSTGRLRGRAGGWALLGSGDGAPDPPAIWCASPRFCGDPRSGTAHDHLASWCVQSRARSLGAWIGPTAAAPPPPPLTTPIDRARRSLTLYYRTLFFFSVFAAARASSEQRRVLGITVPTPPPPPQPPSARLSAAAACAFSASGAELATRGAV